MGGHVARIGVRRGAWSCGGETEGRRPRGRHRRGWEDSIKMDTPGVGLGGKDCIDLA